MTEALVGRSVLLLDAYRKNLRLPNSQDPRKAASYVRVMLVVLPTLTQSSYDIEQWKKKECGK